VSKKALTIRAFAALGAGAKKVTAMTGLVKPSFPEKATAEQTFELIKEDTTQFIERTVARIARGDSVEAGLRELEAFLLHMMACVKRDPGLEVAAYDLYNAAAVIVASSPISAAVVDARPWRLLMDAARRIRARLNVLVPRQDVET
jgi:hypothetical protein